MQCPNCGKDIRSKSQCAFCGHVFTGKEVKELERENRLDSTVTDDYYTPATKKKSGIGSVIWGIFKLVIAIAVLFAVFAFGPQAYRMVKDQFDFGNNQAEETPVISTVDEEPTEEVEEEPVEEQLTLSSQEVNLDYFPMIEVKAEFNKPLSDVTTDTFTFKVKSGDNEVPVEHYSLSKEDKTLSFSFNDPIPSVVTTDTQERTLIMDAESLSVHEEIAYQVPQFDGNQELATKFNEIVTEKLSESGDTSVVMSGSDLNVPLVYNDHSVEADNLLTWFILQRVYESYEDKSLTPETEISVSSELKADNDEGAVAQEDEGELVTVGRLVDLMTIEHDPSAMNHLIQTLGGPNEFNLWLNQSGYFGTKITQKLSLNDNHSIVGASTSAQDITRLLNELASETLVSKEQSEAMVSKLLEIPANDKYPTGSLEEVSRYYEISTSDTNVEHQFFSGILELEGKKYSLVILVNNPTELEETVKYISDAIGELVLVAEGKDPEEESTEEELSPDSQVSIVEEAPVAPVQQAPAQQGPSYSGYQYGSELNQNGLPTTVYNPQTGQYDPIQWIQNEQGQNVFIPAQ